jgi:hypothetical protein
VPSTAILFDCFGCTASLRPLARRRKFATPSIAHHVESLITRFCQDTARGGSLTEHRASIIEALCRRTNNIRNSRQPPGGFPLALPADHASRDALDHDAVDAKWRASPCHVKGLIDGGDIGAGGNQKPVVAGMKTAKISRQPNAAPTPPCDQRNIRVRETDNDLVWSPRADGWLRSGGVSGVLRMPVPRQSS